MRSRYRYSSRDIYSNSKQKDDYKDKSGIYVLTSNCDAKCGNSRMEALLTKLVKESKIQKAA